MRTIQMTLDDDLVETVDRVVKELRTTRSAFTRKALKNAIRQVSISRLEKKHKKGYESYPVGNAEFSVSEAEQQWGDCAINCDHIQTVSKSKIGTLIATLSKEKLAEVGKAVSFALNI